MKFKRFVEEIYEIHTEPCPFCGGTELDFGGIWNDSGIYCTTCMAHGPALSEEQLTTLEREERNQASIAIWNKRGK
jgi:Lar family restriction alleviation protein